MAELLFCTNCAKELHGHSFCDCGHTMTLTQTRNLNSELSVISNYVVTESKAKNLAEANFSKIDAYRLSDTYFLASSAENDYERKVKFIKNDVIRHVSNWSGNLKDVNKLLMNDRAEIFSKFVYITDFVLTEFFGPFRTAKSGANLFEEYEDFGKHQLSHTLEVSNLSLSDIQKTSFGTISNKMLKSMESALNDGSYKSLAKKGDWSKSDVNLVAVELGVAAAGELFSGIVNIVGENTQAIKQVRGADHQLTAAISKVGKQISSLKVSEKELLKQKKLLHYHRLVLDNCFLQTLEPIFKELEDDEDYQSYREERLVYDYQKRKIELDLLNLEENVKVSFWGCLLSSRKRNFRKYWKLRAIALETLDDYNELNFALGEDYHKSLEDSYRYEQVKTEEFKEFEKNSRRVLNRLPAIANNKDKVIKFAGVLKIIKSGLTK